MATFFTDFSEHADGYDLRNSPFWTEYKNTDPFSMIAVDTGGADGTVMRWTNTGATNWNVLVLSEAMSRAGNIQILTAIRYNNAPGSGTNAATMLGPHFNKTGDVANAYRASFNGNAAYWHNAFWRDNSLNNYASRENTTPRPAAGEKWWFRYQVERNTPSAGFDRLSVKYWKDGDSEPAGWLLQDDIATVASGVSMDPGIGGSTIYPGESYDVVQFGVGTDGDAPPVNELPTSPETVFTTPDGITNSSAESQMSYVNQAEPTSNKEAWAIVQADALPDPTAAQIKAGLGGDGNIAAYSEYFPVGVVSAPTVLVGSEGLAQSTQYRFWGVWREQAVETVGSSTPFTTVATDATLTVVMVDGTGTPLPAGRTINYRIYAEATWAAKAAPELSGVAVTASDGSINIDTSGTFVADDIVRLVTDEAGGVSGVTDDYLGASWQVI